jgi:hypothetical protein
MVQITLQIELCPCCNAFAGCRLNFIGVNIMRTKLVFVFDPTPEQYELVDKLTSALTKQCVNYKHETSDFNGGPLIIVSGIGVARALNLDIATTAIGKPRSTYNHTHENTLYIEFDYA